jgi:hypothetical protein
MDGWFDLLTFTGIRGVGPRTIAALGTRASLRRC